MVVSPVTGIRGGFVFAAYDKVRGMIRGDSLAVLLMELGS